MCDGFIILKCQCKKMIQIISDILNKLVSINIGRLQIAAVKASFMKKVRVNKSKSFLILVVRLYKRPDFLILNSEQNSCKVYVYIYIYKISDVW